MMKVIENDIDRSVIGADGVLDKGLTGNNDRMRDARNAVCFAVLALFAVMAVVRGTGVFALRNLDDLVHDGLSPLQRC